jgi:hypothetical protein
MAITTLDGVLAGMLPPHTFAKALTGTMVTGRPHSTFYLAGIPGAAVAPTPGLAGAALTTYAGQIPFANPGAGNTYLANATFAATVGGVIVIADRLWHNSGFTITSTGAQTINSVAWPARDRDGSTNGAGVYLGVEISSTTGSGTPTITVSYTNSAGTAGKSGTNINATVASSIAGTFYPIGLAAGDVGVRSVQTLTLSATWTSGTMHLVAYRELARIAMGSSGYPAAIDAITGGLPRMYDNSVPFVFFIPGTSTTSNITGGVSYTQG